VLVENNWTKENSISIDPRFQKEIRGGRIAPLVAGRSYSDILKTDPGCDEILQRERVTTTSSYISKDGIRGTPNFTLRRSNKEDFDGE